MNQKYHRIRKLGSGGMAEVYLVEACSDGCQYAYKTVRSQDPPYQQAICGLALRREYQVLSSLQHPFVPAVIEQDSEGFYMTYIEGTSLEELVRSSGKLSVTMLQKWLLQVCRILSYVHQQGYAYLDMKPQNLMLDKAGNLFLIDFGTCQKLGADMQPLARTPRLCQ